MASALGTDVMARKDCLDHRPPGWVFGEFGVYKALLIPLMSFPMLPHPSPKTPGPTKRQSHNVFSTLSRSFLPFGSVLRQRSELRLWRAQ
jgi:hypothetical protein